MSQQIIEETQEICSLCGGRGQEQNFGSTSTAMFQTCRQCQGTRYIVTKRIVRFVQSDADPAGAPQEKT